MFKIGERVKATKRMAEQHYYCKKGSDCGVVVRVKSPTVISVQRDGIKSPDDWHVSFWTKDLT